MKWERTDVHMAMRNRGNGIYDFLKVEWLDLTRTDRVVGDDACSTVVCGTVDTNHLMLSECLNYISEIIAGCCRNSYTEEEVRQLVAERRFEESTVCDVCSITTFQKAVEVMERIMQKNDQDRVAEYVYA